MVSTSIPGVAEGTPARLVAATELRDSFDLPREYGQLVCRFRRADIRVAGVLDAVVVRLESVALGAAAGPAALQSARGRG